MSRLPQQRRQQLSFPTNFRHPLWSVLCAYLSFSYTTQLQDTLHDGIAVPTSCIQMKINYSQAVATSCSQIKIDYRQGMATSCSQMKINYRQSRHNRADPEVSLHVQHLLLQSLSG
eukprot:GHVS01021570.1.p1 GENE.GHVS01021570.1~~GHVS01021570.1.p1  ORF type:complete len:116 (+),score=10.16 GHVS01021570.1:129-476(+)